MDKIINAKDYLFREGYKTIKERIIKECGKRTRKGLLETPFVDCEPLGKPVFAKVNFGQWLVECECGGAETVHWDEPIFYCFSCGNYNNHGKPREVIFPTQKEITEIEKLLLLRPVITRGGPAMIERVIGGMPSIKDKYGPLSRSWDPGQTEDDLREENKSIKGKVN